jgi:hypothetical protein
MWYSEEERGIDLKEYICGIEIIKHYDTILWAMGSIFIPISLSLLGLSFTDPVVKLGKYPLFLLAIGSWSLYLFWLFIERRFNFYMKTVFERLHYLERKYGMKTHREINCRDKRGIHIRIIVLIWVFFGVLVALWLFRIFL